MSNLLHIKGSRTQIYRTLPSNSVGNDGDIILSQIQGKGVYLCSKVNGRWHVSTKMEELRKIEKTSIKDLKLGRLKIGNATITKDKYNVSSGDLTLDVADSIILNSKEGKFIAQKNGTEFSAANSAYAGMILGYTYLQPSGSGESHALETSFTVEHPTHKITFVVPPSGKVEIESTGIFNRTSTSDVTIYAGLSDNATYNSLGVEYEYDYSGSLSDDEADDYIVTFKWCVTGLTEGTSTTYYIGFKSSDATAVYLQYGIRASHGLAHHPFIIKATALPATIYDGS